MIRAASRKTNGGVYNTVRGNTALTSGTWYYVTHSTNRSAWKIRVNGSTAQTLTALLGTNTGDWIGDISTWTPDKSDIGGIYAGGAYSSVNFWNGVLDEVRLSNVERSDDWVATEYINQSSPSTFYTITSATSLAAPSKVQWLVADQLGTPRMIVDETGALANMRRHDYLPFGEEVFAGTGGTTTAQGYSASDGVRQKFADKERDNETGLDFSQARYYASMQGRFTSTDPIIMTPERLIDPQEINRYNYARNNPLRFTDPTGEDIDDSSLDKNEDYQKWKKAFLATKAGQAQWDKYANDHSVNITITIGDNDGGKYGAETTPTFDANGKLTGASIVLGKEFAKKEAASADYPIGSQLTSDDPHGGYSVSREARAVFFLSHEFGHVEDAQKTGGAVRQRENALLTENLTGFKNQGQAWFNSSDYQKLLIQCGCKDLNEIHGQRELRAEGYAIPTMKYYYAKHAGHGSMPGRVKQAIQNYEKAHP